MDSRSNKVDCENIETVKKEFFWWISVGWDPSKSDELFFLFKTNKIAFRIALLKFLLELSTINKWADYQRKKI